MLVSRSVFDNIGACEIEEKLDSSEKNGEKDGFNDRPRASAWPSDAENEFESRYKTRLYPFERLEDLFGVSYPSLVMCILSRNPQRQEEVCDDEYEDYNVLHTQDSQVPRFVRSAMLLSNIWRRNGTIVR